MLNLISRKYQVEQHDGERKKIVIEKQGILTQSCMSHAVTNACHVERPEDLGLAPYAMIDKSNRKYQEENIHEKRQFWVWFCPRAFTPMLGFQQSFCLLRWDRVDQISNTSPHLPKSGALSFPA